jgi:hypothetical protein
VPSASSRSRRLIALISSIQPRRSLCCSSMMSPRGQWK